MYQIEFKPFQHPSLWFEPLPIPGKHPPGLVGTSLVWATHLQKGKDTDCLLCLLLFLGLFFLFFFFCLYAILDIGNADEDSQ
jgi:hypothetical protein